ncbi:hypothetical protein BHE74_00040345 [Ensete ventricosum]|uniref:Uncharacterized protein n=1 Tax=Ensete ventricosum TaxID=4639 RepID=A0A444G6B4_ENSVE|nr:hypothetical protein GW17_00005024 [Ensete ventricosum]RWW53189.1 hypothetical protein BHE74_00040345 [Ensete ventricosum]RZR73828.1 hypothetical protein BHM03_00028598 [Ensete ventricosum]
MRVKKTSYAASRGQFNDITSSISMLKNGILQTQEDEKKEAKELDWLPMRDKVVEIAFLETGFEGSDQFHYDLSLFRGGARQAALRRKETLRIRNRHVEYHNTEFTTAVGADERFAKETSGRIKDQRQRGVEKGDVRNPRSQATEKRKRKEEVVREDLRRKRGRGREAMRNPPPTRLLFIQRSIRGWM